ncbi:3-carboxymuconate cyclase [Belliella baltica DSM 15883]|uniref:3-carboxymuconate cyclase n=1 Tax=Belliella baltica (strain DSM 15883 / CIP 108006 / LMG 21964 / BA134) TaxID=866536 RepID=I3Z8Q3_BELBD|nr:lactonase family protein [Belliella baltica]AFL85621.1 3-carboxymuconate cyclase [Belliella baltica DSM 15883]
MKKYSLPFLGLILGVVLFVACDDEPSEEIFESSHQFLIGSYTSSEEEGIGFLEFDPLTNAANIKVIGSNITNPSFLTLNKKQDLLFTVEEIAGENGGRVKSFGFNKGDKELTLISMENTLGDHPCYLTLDPNEQFLVVGNYSGGNFSTFRIDSGQLTHVQTIEHEGKSIIQSRQEKPHIHSLVFHPGGEKMFVSDLGTDKIYIYDFNPNYAVPFQPAAIPYFEVEAGSGPRHLIFNEKGDRFYLIHELTAELGVYAYENEEINLLSTVSLTHPQFQGTVGAAEVKLSQDGKYIYASNRGEANEISVYEKDLNDKLILVQRISTQGVSPRNFNFSNDGSTFIVGNQESNEIGIFDINQKTGMIGDIIQKVAFPKPAYILPLK